VVEVDDRLALVWHKFDVWLKTLAVIADEESESLRFERREGNDRLCEFGGNKQENFRIVQVWPFALKDVWK
jgi:hypothetical protein